MLNGMEFQTVGAAYLKALRPTAVLVNGTCRKLCDADRRVLEGVLRLMRGERYAGEPVWSIRYVTVAILKWMCCLMGSQWSCWRAVADVIAELLRTILARVFWTRGAHCTGWVKTTSFLKVYNYCIWWHSKVVYIPRKGSEI